jgi:DNA recombination protein RmuC
MDLLSAAILALAVAVIIAALVLRRGAPADPGSVAAQLAEVRARLDTLTRAQADLPGTVANGAAVQARALAEVREQLAELVAAARSLDGLDEAVGDLRRVLAVPKLRGALGELWLEELLRDALPPGHVELQYRFRSGERVDAVVRLRDRLVPVDAKFPLDAWQRVLAAEGTEADRERRAFLRAVRARVDEIADKYVRPDEGTTDFAIMYVPAEGVFYEAILRDEPGDAAETTLEYARRRHVLVASPHTLWAYLGAVAHGLRGVVLEAREREVLDALAGLQRDVMAYFDAAEVARRHLGNAVRQFEEAERLGYRLQDRMGALLEAGPPPRPEPAGPRGQPTIPAGS